MRIEPSHEDIDQQVDSETGCYELNQLTYEHLFF
jgi:hypothetical protein